MMRSSFFIPTLMVSLSAHAAIDMEKLTGHIDAGESQQAYAYAESQRLSYEGDPTFDYYYGIAAIDSGNASEGVFALERSLFNVPDNKAARLELGRGYFILEEYARARQEFQTVLEMDPPESVRFNIENYIAAIKLREGRYNTSATSFVEIGLGSDSNVNSGPADANAFSQYIGFDPVFGTSSVSSSSLETDDSFTDLTAGINVRSPFAAGKSWLASVNANMRSHGDASEFDAMTITANGGVQMLKADDTYTLSATLQTYSLDGEDYRDLIAVSGNWKRRLDQSTTLNTGLQYSMADYPGQEIRNTDTTTLSAGISRGFKVAYSPVAYMNLYYATDAPEDGSQTARAKTERDYFGARLGTVLSTSARTSIQLGFNYQQSEYGALDTSLTTPVTRSDDYLNLSATFNWLIQKQWKLISQLSITDNSSNLDTGDYDRTLITVSARYDFE